MLLMAMVAATMAAAPDNDAALSPAAPGDIASAVGDCWQAVRATDVDRVRLGEAGWSVVAGTQDSTQTPLEALVKEGAPHRILLTHAHDPQPFCTVIARLASRGDAGSALEAIQAKLKSLGTSAPASRSGDGIFFLSLPRFVQVDQTDAAGGTEQQPSLRIIVGYEMAEK